jgi:Ala-tRNA(Pro) deacylase
MLQMIPMRLDMGNEGLNRFSASGRNEIPKRLLKYLNENNVRYEILHEPSDSPTQKLQSRAARYYARTVIVRAGCHHLVAVLPANSRIDLKGFTRIGEPVRLETEEEFKWLFPDCAIGGIPPFGNLYGLPTLVDSGLSKNDYIIFPAGTDTDYIKLSYPAYERIVQAQVGSLSIKSDSHHSE